VRPWINTLSDVQNRITSLVRAEITNNTEISIHFCIYFGEYKAWIECFGSESAVDFPGIFPVSDARTPPVANASTSRTATFTVSLEKVQAASEDQPQTISLTSTSIPTLATKLEQTSTLDLAVNESGLAVLVAVLQARQLRLEDAVHRLGLALSACACGKRESE
jgi:hypothetical protein